MRRVASSQILYCFAAVSSVTKSTALSVRLQIFQIHDGNNVC